MSLRRFVLFHRCTQSWEAGTAGDVPLTRACCWGRPAQHASCVGRGLRCGSRGRSQKIAPSGSASAHFLQAANVSCPQGSPGRAGTCAQNWPTARANPLLSV